MDATLINFRLATVVLSMTSVWTSRTCLSQCRLWASPLPPSSTSGEVGWQPPGAWIPGARSSSNASVPLRLASHTVHTVHTVHNEHNEHDEHDQRVEYSVGPFLTMEIPGPSAAARFPPRHLAPVGWSRIEKLHAEHPSGFLLNAERQKLRHPK